MRIYGGLELFLQCLQPRNFLVVSSSHITHLTINSVSIPIGLDTRWCILMGVWRQFCNACSHEQCFSCQFELPPWNSGILQCSWYKHYRELRFNGSNFSFEVGETPHHRFWWRPRQSKLKFYPRITYCSNL